MSDLLHNTMMNKGEQEAPPTIYIGGTFDCFHSGHIELLKRAKRLGCVIVSVNTDEFATSYKRHPLMPLEERVAVLNACKYVDGVIINEGDADSKVSLSKVLPDYIVHGDDWTEEAYLKQMGLDREWLKQMEIVIITLSYTPTTSTTNLLKNYENRGVDGS